MKTSSKGIELIKSFESCQLTAYKCPAGVWTIGWGHTAGVAEGQTITQTQADALLALDLEKYEKYVINTGLALNQNQFDALVSFTYNCGAGNLKKLIANRTLAEIAEAILLYNKSNGVKLSGLVRRRQAERELFLTEVEKDMALIIGHASIDENGNATGGAVGDQNGREVCTRSYYLHSKGWYLLRPKSITHANAIAEAMLRACNNNNIGYDQSNRSGIIKYGTGTTVKTECDCSSLVRQCVIEGTDMDSGNFTTANEAKMLQSMGIFEPTVSVTSSTVLYNGDILVTKTKGHTVIVVAGNPRKEAVPSNTYTQEQFIREVQNILGAKIDGIGGPETLSKTITVSTIWNRKHAVVRPIQRYLNSIGYDCGTVDGIAGSKFKAAVKAYQKDVVKASAKNQDGVITKKGATWKKLLGIS